MQQSLPKFDAFSVAFGEARRGLCHAHSEATQKPEPAPSNYEKNLPQPSASFGQEFATISWESIFEGTARGGIKPPSGGRRHESPNMPSGITSLISLAPTARTVC